MATLGSDSIEVTLPSSVAVDAVEVEITNGPWSGGSTGSGYWAWDGWRTSPTISGSSSSDSINLGATGSGKSASESTVVGTSNNESINSDSTHTGGGYFTKTITTNAGTPEVILVSVETGYSVSGSSSSDSINLGSTGNGYWSGSSSSDSINLGSTGKGYWIGGSTVSVSTGSNYTTGSGYWSGRDFSDGDKSKSQIKGGKDSDKLKGSKKNDYILGDKGAEKIKGGKGDDLIKGGEGNDRIKGGAGNDVIVGGAGKNTAKGNSGADIFVFSKGKGHTKILDFNPSEDHIQVTSGPDGIKLEVVDGNIEIKQNGDLLGVVSNQTIVDAIFGGIIF